MKNQYTTRLYLLLLLFGAFALQGMSQNMVSYAYDQAGNRISRKVVGLYSSPSHVKKGEEPAPVEEQLGERKITVYPNPTKGMLGVEITGGDTKEPLRILLFNADGRQLQSKKAESGMTTINMTHYPKAWYILRVQAGERMTEFKIVKN